MNTHRFIVEVDGCSAEQAEKVMAERLACDEDYGFSYTVNYARAAAPKSRILWQNHAFNREDVLAILPVHTGLESRGTSVRFVAKVVVCLYTGLELEHRVYARASWSQAELAIARETAERARVELINLVWPHE